MRKQEPRWCTGCGWQVARRLASLVLTGHSGRESPKPPACLGSAHTLPDLRVKTGPGGSRRESHVALSPPVRQQRPDQMLGRMRQVPRAHPAGRGRAAQGTGGRWRHAQTRRGLRRQAGAGHSSGRAPTVSPEHPGPQPHAVTPGRGESVHHSRRTVTSPEGRECEEGGVQPKVGTWPSSRPRHPIVTREQAPSPQMPMIRKGPAPALLVLMTHTSLGWAPRGRLNTEGKEA